MAEPNPEFEPEISWDQLEREIFLQTDAERVGTRKKSFTGA